MENGKFLLFLSVRTYKVDTQRQGMRKKVNHWQRSNVFSQKPFISLLLFLCSRVFFFLFWPFFITIFRVVVPAQSFPSLLFIILFLHLSLFFCIFPYLLLVPSSFFPPWLLSLPRFFLSRTKCFHFISCHLLPLLRFLPSWYVREKIHLSVFNKCFISVH